MISSSGPSEMQGQEHGRAHIFERFRNRDSNRRLVAIYEEGIHQIATVCAAAAQGDLEIRVSDLESINTTSASEAAVLQTLVDLGNRLNHMLDMTDAYVRESQGTLQAAREGRFHRRFLKRGLHGTFARGAEIINSSCMLMKTEAEAMLHRQTLAVEFEKEVRGLINSVAAAATQASTAAGVLAENAQDATVAIDRAAEASERVNSEIELTVRHGASVAASADKIASQATLSLSMTETAHRSVGEIESHTKELDEQIRGIGSVINLIREIAFQTNILSLNAAVEAARAGDAGRGFSVVAEEVRGLAGRTAEATQTVESRIAALQMSTRSVVSKISRIGDDVSQCSRAARDIANATNEQHAAAAKLRQSMAGANEGIRASSDALVRSQTAAEETSVTASEVHLAATELEKTARCMDKALNNFLSALRGNHR